STTATRRAPAVFLACGAGTFFSNGFFPAGLFVRPFLVCFGRLVRTRSSKGFDILFPGLFSGFCPFGDRRGAQHFTRLVQHIAQGGSLGFSLATRFVATGIGSFATHWHRFTGARWHTRCVWLTRFGLLATSR